MREIVFDTETTGFDPTQGHRVVELGCVELVNGIESGRTLQIYFNPERDMPPEAFRIHGLSEQFLSAQKLFADHIDEICEFLGDDARLIAHNAGFDFTFLDAEFARCGRPPLSRDRMVDTAALARRRHPGAKHTLDALCTRYGVDRSHRDKHGALLDAELLAQVYIEMQGGRQIALGWGDDDGDTDCEAASATVQSAAALQPDAAPTPPIIRPPRHFAPSAEELARHAAFVATLKDPLWAQAL